MKKKIKKTRLAGLFMAILIAGYSFIPCTTACTPPEPDETTLITNNEITKIVTVITEEDDVTDPITLGVYLDPLYWIEIMIQMAHAAYAIEENSQGILLRLCYQACMSKYDDCWYSYYGECAACFERCDEAFGS